MKKIGKTKLQLGKETLRALTSDAMVQVHGGGGIFTLLCSVRTQVIGCDLPSDACSMGYDNHCGSSLIG